MSLWLDQRIGDPDREPIAELQRQNRQLRALYALGDVLIAGASLPAIYEAAIAALMHALEPDRASVLRFDGDGVMRFKAWRGLSDTYRAATEGHSPWAPDTRDPEPIVVPDVSSEQSLSEPLRRVILTEGIQALAFVPVAYQGRLLGKFMLYYNRPHQFGDEEIMLARTIAGHIAFALGRAQAADDLASSRAGQQRAEQIRQFLTEVTTLLAGSLEYEETLPKVAQLAVPTIADWCFIHLAQPDGRVRQVGIAHQDPDRIAWALRVQERYGPNPASQRWVLHVIDSGRSELYSSMDEALLRDAAQDTEHLALLREAGFSSVMIVPLKARGRVLGAITLIAAESGRHYQREDLELVEDLARRAALAVDNARLYDDERTARQGAELARDRLALLHRVTTALSGAISQNDVAEVILRHGVPAVEATGGGVACIDADGTALMMIGAIGQAPVKQQPRRDLPLDANTPLATAARTGRPVWIESAEAWEQFDPETARRALLAGAASWAVLPLLAEGRVLGSLGLAFAAPRPFDQDERALLLALADQCAQSLRRARLYEAERAAHRQAQEAISVRDEFLSVASHELRTPLTSLRARAQLALRRLNRDGGVNPAQVTSALEEIGRQADRLGVLITQLLDVSRLQAGQLTLEREPLDLVSLVRQVIDGLPRTAEHPVELRAPDRLGVVADGLRLEQVLTNLLDNAVKYSPEGGLIEVELQQPSPHLATISVRDHGSGIPPERRDGIFERYYRAHTDTYQSGLGLGLYITRQIVELHGGTIAAELPDDGGARFVIRLPTG